MNDILTYEDVLNEVSFEISREKLTTEKSLETKHDAVIRNDDNRVLGLVKTSMDIIPYKSVMAFMKESLDKAQIPFEIQDSVVTGKGSKIFQKWVLKGDQEMDDPEGEGKVSPMLILRSSYLEKTTKIEFGTFRYVCSNGAVVGETIKKFILRDSSDLIDFNYRDTFVNTLDAYVEIKQKHKSLVEDPFETYLWAVMMADEFTYALKKEIVENLVTSGIVNALNAYSKVDLTQKPMNVLEIKKEGVNAWMFYNLLTAIATHSIESSSAQDRTNRLISKTFNI